MLEQHTWVSIIIQKLVSRPTGGFPSLYLPPLRYLASGATAKGEGIDF